MVFALQTHTVYIGLGSNLDQPLKQLKTALKSLVALENTQLVNTSSFYGSKPLGPQDQPDFVNAVCALETSLSATELLSELQQLEQSQGRVKKRHWGERLIDLDILLYGDEIINLPDLQVPHAQMHLRDFVLIPLAEIAPQIIIPGKESIQSLINELDESFLISLN